MLQHTYYELGSAHSKVTLLLKDDCKLTSPGFEKQETNNLTLILVALRELYHMVCLDHRLLTEPNLFNAVVCYFDTL